MYNSDREGLRQRLKAICVGIGKYKKKHFCCFRERVGNPEYGGTLYTGDGIKVAKFKNIIYKSTLGSEEPE